MTGASEAAALPIEHVLESVEATEAWAEALARHCPQPFHIGLSGELGAGKTSFVRGFVRALNPRDEVLVASPTYAICHRYPGPPTVHHLDLYRLEDEDDLESVGFRDLLGSGILLVEWPEVIDAVLATLDVLISLEHGADEAQRLARVTCLTNRGEAWWRATAADVAELRS